MSKEILSVSPFWKTIRVAGVRKWIYLDKVYRIVGKSWLNKATMGVSIHIGYETEEYKTTPISNEIYHISIDYYIANYFGDTSGMHFRSKEYVLIDGALYKQSENGALVSRMTKELKGIMEEIGEMKKGDC